ncbi:MAG: heavy metal translocating P-type ATPase, partial [Candidatus Kapaibacterium sp.]
MSPVRRPSTERREICEHCGAVCLRDVVRDNGRVFCCSGCRMVHGLSGGDAVCDVMDDTAFSGGSFPRLGIPRFGFLDEPESDKPYIRFRGTRTTQCDLDMPTIHCASCVRALENLHRVEPAVLSSEVNFLRRTVSITFLHDDLRFRQLVELCTRLGYEPDLRLERGTADAGVTSMRSLVMKLGVAGFAFGNAMIFSAPDYLAAYHGDGRALTAGLATLFAVLRVALSIPVLVYSASDYFRDSWHALRRRSVSLEVPVAMGLLALYGRSIWDIATGSGSGYLDSFTGLVFFLLTARIIQTKSFRALAFDRTFASFFPLSATVEGHDGAVRNAALADIRVDDICHVRPDEILPADGVLVDTHAHVDYSFVTGEADLSEVVCGAALYAGGRIHGRTIRYRVTRSVSHSHLTRLWNASVFHRDKVRRAETVSLRFALYFTLSVLLIASLTAWAWWPDAVMAVSASVAVLIVACPCALTLASPFTLGAAMSMLGRDSLYLRSADVVADLAAVDTVVFDKTGTLTSSDGHDVRFVGPTLSIEERRMILALVSVSVHPLSRAVTRFLRSGGDESLQALHHIATGYHEIPGRGIEATVSGHRVRIGSPEFVAGDDSVSGTDSGYDNESAAIHVSVDGAGRGRFCVTAALRPGVPGMI